MKSIIICTAIFLSIGCCAQKKPIPGKPKPMSIPRVKIKLACGDIMVNGSVKIKNLVPKF